MRDQTHREHVRDPFVAPGADLPLDFSVVQLLEAFLERPPPVAPEHAPDPRRAPALNHLADHSFGLGPQIVIVDSNVPEKHKSTARPQHTGDLRSRLVGREPVEGLGREDRVDLAVFHGDRLPASAPSIRSSHDLLQDAEHRSVRLDGDYAREPWYERASQLPGACAEVEHDGLWPKLELRG